MSCRIAEASAEDIPSLAKINASAYMKEPIAKFAYKDGPDEKNSYELHQVRLHDRFTHADTRIFKAIDTAGDILGFACWTLENKEARSPPKSITQEVGVAINVTPAGEILQQMPAFFNAEFVATTAADVEQLRLPMQDEEKRYYLSAFAVLPSEQGRGIGSRLLRHCLDIADREGLATWLIGFPGSHSLYLRYDFKDVQYKDIDLNAWDKGRMRGWGIYRQYAMVREARGTETV